MPLSREEQTLLVEAAAAYPEGVPAQAWGFGPLMETIECDFPQPTPDTDPEEVEKYG